tara:strand:- start:243 stop:566 length:324 start_codon:yes stop_codon:yes gene_type:complete
MLDFGWPELLVIIIITVFMIGPDDIPKVMVALGRIFRRIQYIKFALSQQFEDVMRDADLDDIRKSVNFEDRTSDDEAEFNEADADEDYIAELEQSKEGQGEDDDERK